MQGHWLQLEGCWVTREIEYSLNFNGFKFRESLTKNLIPKKQLYFKSSMSLGENYIEFTTRLFLSLSVLIFRKMAHH